MAQVPRRAIVCGGSIGGLFAASALIELGWHVDVFERTPVALAGRGAGIVTHNELIRALEGVGADTTALGVAVHERVAYDLDGERVAAFDYDQIVTSWDRMFQVLRPLVPDGQYHLGATAISFEDRVDDVVVSFSDGSTRTADLLVGADGFRSAIRAQLCPEVLPEYAGYVVWRTLAHEADLPQSVRHDIAKTFGYFIPNGTQIIGYPIAGPDNDLRPRRLRYNFVWYSKVAEDDLVDMRTDKAGVHHPVSIPPPLIRDEVIADMYADAKARLPTPFNDMLAVSERPFFTPIFDHHSSVMAKGHVALLGDAACVARPHVGMGVTKAADDALTLAEALSRDRPIAEALAQFSKTRVPACRIAYETGRRLGSLIFSGSEATNRDGRSHPQMEEVMRETAVIPAELRRPT